MYLNAIRKDDGRAPLCAKESQRSAGNELSRADIEECRSRIRVSDSEWALRVFLSWKWISKQEKSLCKIERKEFKKLPFGT